MLPTKFRFIWQSGFRGEDFFQKLTNQKQEFPVVAMFVNGSKLNQQSLQRTFQGCFLLNFHSFGSAVSEKIFQKSTNQKEELPVTTMFIKDQDEMSSPYKGSSIDASYHVSLHLGRRFQKIFFFKSTNRKQELPVAAMLINGLGRNEHSLQRTLHRCFLPSFGSFGQAALEEKIFKFNQSETRIACGSHVC